ncbi:Uroporphyrin-III C/tetrapyrrole (Corrin/Porphyrin) methyltransferase [Geobacter metallireducens RCH3]|uniref:Ribosomal RNA small subunit methyltransferase I n=1 Tax=Geobacter metallireducens (strain ATCC 53774 / DSM 7210 / GS-15) TaxID=269799 RepID=Q39RP5_GEOMG|nr:16S rRNA (cytidine(1402)-2'-O)-methyltransferase [Geobacter metallireducens]ABB33079.1 16S rRNA (2'-O-methyl-C1402)-methyltransferase [Geobacter metallireducens GS-15]EHP84156.1 Uroporphyrin-III C/tetrapyrrole (Corrin/Porphyrin) methyltransferase [Geobacter metallireducens RCH3]
MKTPGTLYIVATPIGNLEDITFRAVRILKEVDLIAAEDTRHTRKLLTHFGISKPLTSYFDHNKHLKGDVILARLRDGASVALVSDAGTPCVADPGYQLVRDSIAEGIVVVPIPGASAAVAALSAAGLPTDSFTFIGFLPSRQGKRHQQLSSLKDEPRVLIFYEAPNRLMTTLRDMRDLWGERKIVVARELTKVYEEFVRGDTSAVIAQFADRQIKGEVVILVTPAEDSTQEGASAESLDEVLRRYLFVEGLSLKDAVKRASVDLGLARSLVYSEALRISSGS